MINTILTIAFVIVCVLLILLVLVQDDGQNGMGGLFGGRGTAAFGSHSATVLTKATRVLAILFFALSIGLALVNRTDSKETDKAVLESVNNDEAKKLENSTETLKSDANTEADVKAPALETASKSE